MFIIRPMGPVWLTVNISTRHTTNATPKAAKGNYFGPNLRRAIMEFQRRVRIQADGNVGPITYGELKKYGFTNWKEWR